MLVDVIINLYGKPWETLCTLKSLMLHSGKHIDKIYVIEEKEQPYNDDMSIILKSFDNIIHYIPEQYIFTARTYGRNLNNINERYIFRYQYGIENSDKKYVFITHNDILYTGDAIGDMLNQIGDSIGIGSIGQCWNCPAWRADLCNGDKITEYNPTYDEIIKLTETYVPARYTQFNHLIDKAQPMPLPECRLNEFACLINRELTIQLSPPYGDAPLFGAYDTLDLGDAWFRNLVLKGFKFTNYNKIYECGNHRYIHDINEDTIKNYNVYHGFFAQNSGYGTQQNLDLYIESELKAKSYYELNYTKGVTFTLTACGRPDLLERTLDSFLIYNTYPIIKYIITEDSGIDGLNDALIERYKAYNIEWIINTPGVGQIKSIDTMYSKVETEYIFHCEDDWIFTEQGFIEKSLKILENDKNIFLIWLRAQNDTNGHPIIPYNHEYDIAAYDYLSVWHGFSFNPGLRRLSDYKLLGNYQSIGHEPQISQKYRSLGFKAAILKNKHIEHIGWGRHTTDK